MRVIVVSSTVFQVNPPWGLSNYGGLEVIAWEQAKGLAAKGHEVSLVAPEGSSCPGVTVIPCGPAGGWSEAQAYNVYWQELLKYDVCIDHSWSKMSYILKMEGRLKAPILAWMHAPVPTMYQKPPPVDKPCLVCISYDQSYTCSSHLHVASRVCYNGASTELYRRAAVKSSGRYLFLARFSSIKNPQGAIVVCKAAGAGLDLIGDTSITNEPELLAQCQREADGRQIRLVGPASRGECVIWYSQAKALLHPVRFFQEPFGLAPVESMLCETPVIAWNNGAMRETILPNETGFLVESERQMVDLIRSDAVSSINGKRCREWAAEHFSLTRMVDRVEELLVEALAGGW